MYFRYQEEYCNIPFRCQYFALDDKNLNLKEFLNVIAYLSLKACQIDILKSLSGKKLKWLSPTILKRKI